MKRALQVYFFLLLFNLPIAAFASHIVGGELSYKYLGNNNYQIKLELYRDCSNPNNSNFDQQIKFYFFKTSTGQLVDSTGLVSYPGAVQLPNNTGNICLVTPPNVCVQEAVYTTNKNLLPVAGGYTIVYQRCCRNATILNINNPNTYGATFLATIPDASIATGNSSPVFTNFPPTCICVNEPLVFNHVATDLDGDQLVYSFYNPFNGGGQGNPTPSPPPPPPYAPIPFTGGYTFSNPVGGTPQVGINSSSGIITGIPNTLGQFVVGVCVKEYRNGNLVSSHYRDFQFNVVQCIQNVNAIIPPTFTVCKGAPLTFSNTSTNATYYHWDFGVAGNADTSNLISPTYTYNTAGTYTVKLIVNLGYPCADTAISIVTVNPIPTATPTNNSPICVGSTLNLFAAGVAGATYSWTGPNGFSSSLQNPLISNATIANAGLYHLAVTLNGCTSANAGNTTVVINTIPSAPIISTNAPICVGVQLQLFCTTVPGATYQWTGPNGWTSNLQNPVINVTVPANAGSYTCSVTVLGCTGSSSTTNVVLFPSPTAPTPSNNSPFCPGNTLNLTAATVAGATYAWIGPNGFSSSLQNPTIPNTTAANAGNYSLTIQVNGCNSLPLITNVIIYPIPVATPTSNSPVCPGTTINLFAATVAGGSYSWIGPNGFTSLLQNPVIPNATNANGGVYTLSVVANGCTNTNAGTTTVVINPVPAAPVLSNNSPICVGATLQLNAANVNNATFQWTGPNGFTSSLQNPIINPTIPANAGVYSCIVIKSGCLSAPSTTTVVLNPIPTAPAPTSNAPICQGFNLNLIASLIPGASYSWIGPGGFSSSLQNPTISNTLLSNAGNYSLTINVNGCNSLPLSTNVIIYPTQNSIASSNSPTCNGQAVQLFASTIAGGSYSWTGPSGFTSTVQNPVIPISSAINAGVFTVTATANGCLGNPSSTTVVVNPIPAAPVISNNAPMCSGQTLNLTAQNITGGTFHWTGPNNFISNLQNPVIPNVPFANSGIYNATVTVLGCTSLPAITNAIINLSPPATPVNNGPLCDGQTLNLTTQPIAGSTYSWIGPNGFSSNQQNPVINNVSVGSNAGSYSLTMSLGGCVGNTVLTNVIIYPIPSAPVLSSNSPICAGQTLQLNALNVPAGIFNWTGPNSFSSSIQNPIITSAPITVSGTYNATVKVFNCTSPASSIVVLVKPVPLAPGASSNSPICAGQPISLTAGNIVGGIYSWNGPAAFTSVLQNPSISNSATANSGNYSVTASVNGCSSPASTVNVIVYPIPSSAFNLTPTSICAGANSIASYSGSSLASATYNWNFGSAIISSGSGQGPYNLSWANSGNYNVTLSVTENGCNSPSTSHSIIVYPIPSSTFNLPTAICQSDSALISYTGSASATGIYTWDFGGGIILNGSGQGPYQIKYNSAGTYTITLTVSENGCSSVVTSQSITVNPVPTADFIIAPSTICPDQDALMTYIGTASSNAIFNWNFDSGTINSGTGIGPYSINFLNSGIDTITLSVTENNCTSSTISQIILIDSLPHVFFTVTDSLGCDPFTTSFINQSLLGNSFFWNFGDDGISTEENPTHTYNPGKFSVKLIVTTSSGCIDSLSKPDLIEVLNNPVAKFSATPEAEVVVELKESTFSFINQSLYSNSYKWFFGDGDSSTAFSTNHTYVDSGNYEVMLIAYDSIGCTDTFILGKFIVVPNIDYFIPNAFTPNNDGVNDIFYVYGRSLKTVHLSIFDRIGEKVFESNGIYQGWDGIYKNSPVNTGVYVYYAEVETLKGDILLLKGDVTLIR